jgi:hypothetical protein
MRRKDREENMIRRLFVFLAVIGMGWSAQAAAQTTCPNGVPASAAGICPIFVQGDPSCVNAAQICGVNIIQQLVFYPAAGSSFGVTVKRIGSAVDVKDTQSAPDQQFGRPGIDVIIARRNGAFVYCGADILHDVVTAPDRQAPNQVTICFAKGPCGLKPADVASACNVYNNRYLGTVANFLQAYRVGPLEQDVNICGCPPFVARFCDFKAPVLDEEGKQRFVACNQNRSPLKATEAEGTTTIGTDSCVLRTIGGRRILIDSATGQLC